MARVNNSSNKSTVFFALTFAVARVLKMAAAAPADDSIAMAVPLQEGPLQIFFEGNYAKIPKFICLPPMPKGLGAPNGVKGGAAWAMTH